MLPFWSCRPTASSVRLAALFCLFLPLGSFAAEASTITALGPFRTWAKAEFLIEGVPAAANNFDPDLIAVDATVTAPSGRSVVIPAFWYQDYSRNLVAGVETVAPAGSPCWHLRTTPTEAGEYRLEVRWRLNGGRPSDPVLSRFTVAPGSLPRRTGWVRVGGDHRYFETSDGLPLRFIGARMLLAGKGGNL